MVLNSLCDDRTSYTLPFQWVNSLWRRPFYATPWNNGYAYWQSI